MKGAIGIDIGGTKIAFGAVTADGRIVAQRTIATQPDDSFDAGFARLIQGIEHLLADAGWQPGDFGGIGVGCPGPVDIARGIIKNVHTLPGWSNQQFAAPLSARFNTPVRMENDANAALLGEALAGAARGRKSAVMLTIGTGIGGAVLLDGRIYHGAGGAHPEIGHIAVQPNGPECYCGRQGCFKVIAAGPAIAAAGAKIGLNGSEAVFTAAAQGEPRAAAIIDAVTAATETAVWSLLHSYLPELILFGGGIVDSHWPLFEAAAQKSLAAAVFARDEGVSIARATLGNDAGMVGAASLVL
ncbi:MAG: ROK family protein [Proteobacteria bacterium]|nr:ROK family protein [Pseudomonadota bacterium]MDA1357569.1 ROK family protein [Pseudomonadota bacterium]